MHDQTFDANILRQPKGAIEAYQHQDRELMTGEKIRWLKNDYSQNIHNAEEATITHLKGTQATVQLACGKTVKMDMAAASNQHWDYAYASTTHHAQGKTCRHVIIHSESTNPNLTHQRAFYVEISRATHQVSLFTDDKQQLINTLKHHTGEKHNALDTSKSMENQPLSIGQTPEKSLDLSR